MNCTHKLSLVFFWALCILSCDKRTPSNIIDPITQAQLKPIASFTHSSDSIAVGQKISFTNTSQKNPTSVQWNFKGGNPYYATDPIVSVQYDTIGRYDVRLTTKNNFGSDSIFKRALIKVYSKTDFSTDLNTWNVDKNWSYSTSNNIPGNKGMLAYSTYLNASTATIDYGSLSKIFTYVPKNAELKFWYYIYSSKGILTIKENGKVIGSISGFDRGVASLPLIGGGKTTIQFDATLYQTSSIYISNVIINPL